MEIIFASNSKNKYLEMAQILKMHDIELIDTYKINENEIIEDGSTFKENAIIKARTFANKFNKVSMADDSGIIVHAIEPLPGIYSKRYSGLGDYENNIKLLDVLLKKTNRSAKFVCVIAIAFPNGKIFTYEGHMFGSIALNLKGDMGFGYDPIFIPNEKHETLAQLGPVYKDQHSHRRNALDKFLEAKNEGTDYWGYTW